jgi:type II secretory pathway pseudopilin PulG
MVTKLMKRIFGKTAPPGQGSAGDSLRHFCEDQKGITLIELILVIAVTGALVFVVAPNISSFMGSDKLIAAANTEALNVKTAAISYLENPESNGKYPPDSDKLWHDPPLPTDYISSQPRAYYTIDIGTGKISSASADTIGHIPANPWTGIKWDTLTDSWVKK